MDNGDIRANELCERIRKDLGQDTNAIRNNERLLYAIPYDVLSITSPHNKDEKPIELENVIVAVKKKILDNYDMDSKIFELYTEHGEKIGSTDEDGRMIFDKEILEELIKDKIKIIRENGKEPAGVDSNLNVESFFEIIGRQIVALNEEEKEKIDKSADRRLCLAETTQKHYKSEIKNKISQDDNNLEEQKLHELEMKQMKDELGFDIHKITKINPCDGAFWENNPDFESREGYAVLTQDGSLKIVGKNNGKFEEAKGFHGSSNKQGRTTVIFNDDDNLEDNVYNTYGEIYPDSNPNMRYTVVYDQMGGIRLVEQISHNQGSIEESEKYVSREVANSNTNFLEQNLEGNENSENITIRTFRQYKGMNSDAKMYGDLSGIGGISGKVNELKNNHRDFNMESLATDGSQKFEASMDLIKNELNDRGISLDPDEEEHLESRIAKLVSSSNRAICKEEAVAYADEVQMVQKKNEKDIDNDNKEEYTEGNKEKENDEKYNRSLADEAWKRRMRGL